MKAKENKGKHTPKIRIKLTYTKKKTWRDNKVRDIVCRRVCASHRSEQVQGGGGREKCADELLTLPFLLEQVPVAMNNVHP